MDDNQQIISINKKAEAYVRDIYSKASTNYVYHNFKHSELVVKAIRELSEAFNLPEEDQFILEVAGWFHDIAYEEKCEGHEPLSAAKATEFLQANNASAEFITKVVSCINATQINHIPQNLMEMIIRDADSAHLGKKSGERRSDLLRMEWELVDKKIFTEEEWIQTNLDFLQKHEFYTTIAKSEWNDTKNKRIQSLKKKLKELKPNPNKKDKTPNKPKKPNPVNDKKSRGVETMFRVTLRNHINLSRIADNKANFLMSVNAIIVSLLLGELVTDNKPVIALILPSVYFLIVCSITMVLAILAARPNITKGKFSREGLLQKKTNILFFGNFHKMPLDDFNWGMNELMKDDELLYDSLTKDLYYLGKVMHKKYQLLRYAFTFFMFGIISSLLFYLVMMLIRN